MKSIYKSVAIALGIFVVGNAAAASDFPTRALTITVPFTAGGATDVLARTIAEGLSKELKQPVVVANVPGAGGSIGQSRLHASRQTATTCYWAMWGHLPLMPRYIRTFPTTF